MSRRRTTQPNSSQRTVTIAVFLILVAAWALFTFWPKSRAAVQQALQTPVAQLATSLPLAPGAPTAAPNTGNSAPSTAGPWQVWFTTPRYPDNPAYHVNGLDTHLVALLATAQRTIDMAIYDFDLQNVAQAMADAAKRGVRVRMVTDTDTLSNKDAHVQAAFAILKAAKIPIVDDKRGPIMHNKFVVVDSQTVLTGSWNFTDGDTYHLNNNAIQLQSTDLAQNYTTEFEKMFVKRTFGPNKQPGVPHPRLTLNGAPAQNYFASEDNVAVHVVEQLRQAKQSIDFMAFQFTSNPLGEAVLERAKAGVKVRGVFETTGSQTQFSEFGPMKQAGLEVYTDGNPYVMHHKVFIIDGHLVIFGSYNFSDNADHQNDENLLMIDDPILAQQFEAEFLRVREQAINPPKKK